MGFINCTLPTIVLRYSLGSDGRILDYWNIGVASSVTGVLAYHIFTMIETRAYSPLLLFALTVSLGFLPVLILLNNGAGAGFYYKMQFEVLLRSPLFLLTVLLSTAVICLPKLA